MQVEVGNLFAASVYVIIPYLLAVAAHVFYAFVGVRAAAIATIMRYTNNGVNLIASLDSYLLLLYPNCLISLICTTG